MADIAGALDGTGMNSGAALNRTRDIERSDVAVARDEAGLEIIAASNRASDGYLCDQGRCGTRCRLNSHRTRARPGPTGDRGEDIYGRSLNTRIDTEVPDRSHDVALEAASVGLGRKPHRTKRVDVKLGNGRYAPNAGASIDAPQVTLNSDGPQVDTARVDVADVCKTIAAMPL